MFISFRDAQRLWSGIWHKEELINNKRRWLMQLLLQDTNEVDLKKLKKLRSLSNAFLAESFVRRDEASYQTIKINIERNHRVLCYTEERLHDFHNNMLLSDIYILQCFLMEPFNLVKFHSIVDLLSNNALGLLADLVTEDKADFERTRSRMKKVIKNHFSNDRSASKDEALVATLRHLYEVLRKHENDEENQPCLMTPKSALPSIYKALELLVGMPIFALTVVSRKLNGKKAVRRFPPSKIGYNKKEFVKRIRGRCQKLIRTLEKENSMPEELAKAMSIIHLYFKYKTKCSDTFTTKFLPFSTGTVALQKDVLNALWSIPKITSYQMKALQAILGVKLEDDSSSFLNDLKQYLIQYLLECEEIEIPGDITNVLAVLNQSPLSQPQICSKEKIEVVIEAVLNVSIELNQIVSHLGVVWGPGEVRPAFPNDAVREHRSKSPFRKRGFFPSRNREEAALEEKRGNPNSRSCKHMPRRSQNSTPNKALVSCTSTDEKAAEGLESDDDTNSNDFELVENDYCSNTVKYQQQQKNELEIIGDSIPGTCFVSATSDSCSNVKKLEKEQDDADDLIPHYKEPIETSIKQLCDETSLVSYRLIGHMLDSFLLVEGRDVGVATRHHLTGEAFDSTSFQDKSGLLDSSEENVGIKALMHSINDLLPSIPKRCTQQVEKLMKQP